MSADIQPAGDFSEIEARRWVKNLTALVENVHDRIIEGYERRAWIALGYESWAELCDAEFQLPKLNPAERQVQVKALRDAGLSQRAIGAAVGVSKGTVENDLRAGAQNWAPEGAENDDAVVRDLSGAPNGAPEADSGEANAAPVANTTLDAEPERITGLDGRSYPAAQPAPPPRRRPEPEPEPTPTPQPPRKRQTLQEAADWAVENPEEADLQQDAA